MKVLARAQTRQHGKPEKKPGLAADLARPAHGARPAPERLEAAPPAPDTPAFAFASLKIMAPARRDSERRTDSTIHSADIGTVNRGISPENKSAAQRVAEATQGPGEPLPDRARFEGLLGVSLAGVAVYRGPLAQAALDSLGSEAGSPVRAAARGRKILLGAGPVDEQTLLHELVHTVQGEKNHPHEAARTEQSAEITPAGSPVEEEARRISKEASIRQKNAPPLAVRAALGPQAIALQRTVETLERPRSARPGMESWVVAPEAPARGPENEARRTSGEARRETQPETARPPRQSAPAEGARAGAEAAAEPQPVQPAGDLPEAEAPVPGPAAGAAVAGPDLAAQQAAAQAASASLQSADTPEAKIAAFASAPPSVKAQYAGTLGQDAAQLSQQQAQETQSALPEFHARLDTPVEEIPPLQVQAPAGREVNLEPAPPPPAPDPDISPTPAPTPYLANQSVTTAAAHSFESAPEGQREAQVSESLASVRTRDPELDTSPGPPPQVPLEGETDPQRLSDQTAAGLGQAQQAHAEARTAILEGPGPERVQPRQIDEAAPAITLETPSINAGTAPEGPQAFTQAGLAPDVVAAFDQDQAAPMQASMADAQSQMETAAQQRDRDRDEQVRQAEADASRLNTQADADQRAAVLDTRRQIQTERRSTMEDQDEAVQNVQRDANQRRERDRGEIDRRVESDQRQIDTRYNQAGRDAEAEVTRGEQRAEQERRDAEREAENQSWWDRAVNFVRDAFNALVNAISAIFDAVRRAVNVILDAVKSIAQGLIDALASVIKAAIRVFGEFLKGLVDGLIGNLFPELAARLNRFIDSAVAAAERAVDAVAEGLKAGINALVEGLRAGINAVLNVFNNILQLGIGLIQAALTGDWSEFFRKALEAVLRLVGVDPEEFYAFVGRAQETFQIIVNDPGAFLGHVLDALLGGFRLFGENFLTHLQAGIIGWLTGALGSMGITLPERFDLMGCLSLVQQILGLTWENLRQKAVRLIGERNVARIEFMFSYIQTLVEGGWSALFERITQDLSGLVDTVLDGIKNFLVQRVVIAAVTRLATLFNPVGAVVQLVMAIWNLYTWVRDQLQRIIQVVRTVVDAIGNIARGIIEPASQAVERVLANLLPLFIDLLARFLNLGGIAERVREILTNVRRRIDTAIDRLIERVLSTFRGGGGREAAAGTAPQGAEGQPAQPVQEQPATGDLPQLSPQEAAAVKQQALTEANRRLRVRELQSLTEMRTILADVYREYRPRGLKSLGVHMNGDENATAYLYATASEPQQLSITWSEIFGDEDTAITTFQSQPRNETNAAISFNGRRIGEVVKSEGGHHAEENLVATYWDQVIQMAREAVSQNQPATIAIAINRAPCHLICSPLLTNLLNQVDPQLKERVRFILAPTGTYEPSEQLTEEEVQRDRQELTLVAQRLGLPVKTFLRDALAKVTYTEDTTTFNDLRRLVSAGWDLRQLQARPTQTTAGSILAESAHKLAVEANRIKVEG